MPRHSIMLRRHTGPCLKILSDATSIWRFLTVYRLIYRASSGQPMRLPKHYPKPVLILFEEHGAAAFRHGAGFCDPTGDRSSTCSRRELRGTVLSSVPPGRYLSIGAQTETVYLLRRRRT